ncbi:MAG TPA: ABC transporter permease [Bacteroidales bacterium]|jgi:lipopolysaccharide transport system permease protein|nr:ABC transporter permease [Bacteroidales bacterium]
MQNMEIEIKPPSKWHFFDIKELIYYKDTLYFLTWKDIKVKYKQAVLGFLWAFLQPIAMTAVFVLFNLAVNVSLGDVNIPYPLFVLSGIMLWNLFANAITATSNSVVNNSNILKKIYFPRIFFPMSSLLVSLFDFFITLLIYIPVMIYYNVYPNWQIIYILPVCILLVSILVLGIGSFFGALNVKYRDVKYIIPFVVQLLFFISPVFYSNNQIALPWVKTLYYLNPMTGIIELFRFGLFNTPINNLGLILSIIISLTFFVIGLYYFRKTEYFFADIS